MEKEIKNSSKKLMSETIEFVSKNIENSEKNLDVLSGYCNFLIALVKKTKLKFIGIDNSNYIIRIANKNIRDERLSNLIKIKKADARNLPFNSNYFTSVTNFGGWGDAALFCGKNGIKSIIKEMSRVLRPEGRFIIAFPLLKGKTKIQKTDEKIQIYLYGRKRHYPENFFEEELKKNKIKIIKKKIISTKMRISFDVAKEFLKRHEREVKEEFGINAKSYEQVIKKFGKFILKNGYSSQDGMVILIGKKI